MNENLLAKTDDSPKIAEKHVSKYIYDLQRHFSLSDSQTIQVLNSCIFFLKKRDTGKKWWHFF